MDNHRRFAESNSFARYLQSLANLDRLESMTSRLDAELAESQQMMADIKKVLDSYQAQPVQNADNGLRHEDLSKFLEAGVPKLLMPDMEETSTNLDLNDIITSMRGYAEEIKKNIVLSPPRPQASSDQPKSFDLQPYAASLDKLGKRLANMKFVKTEDGNGRDPQLEEKLGQLCRDVDMFTQVVQTKTKLSETNQNWSESQVDKSGLEYDAIINKLLAGINEVMYLYRNKK